MSLYGPVRRYRTNASRSSGASSPDVSSIPGDSSVTDVSSESDSTKRSREIDFVNELMTLDDIDKVDKLIRARREFVQKQISDKKKLQKMVTTIPNLVELMDSCEICMNPLLENIGTASFGVISYTCECSVVRTIHLKCCMSTDSTYPKCAYCRTPITFVVPTLVENSPMFKKIRVRKTPIRSEPDSEYESESESQVLFFEESQDEETIDETFLGLN